MLLLLTAPSWGTDAQDKFPFGDNKVDLILIWRCNWTDSKIMVFSSTLRQQTLHQQNKLNPTPKKRLLKQRSQQTRNIKKRSVFTHGLCCFFFHSLFLCCSFPLSLYILCVGVCLAGTNYFSSSSEFDVNREWNYFWSFISSTKN